VISNLRLPHFTAPAPRASVAMFDAKPSVPNSAAVPFLWQPALTLRHLRIENFTRAGAPLSVFLDFFVAERRERMEAVRLSERVCVDLASARFPVIL
jgi:hypothetical protein